MASQPNQQRMTRSSGVQLPSMAVLAEQGYEQTGYRRRRRRRSTMERLTSPEGQDEPVPTREETSPLTTIDSSGGYQASRSVVHSMRSHSVLRPPQYTPSDLHTEPVITHMPEYRLNDNGVRSVGGDRARSTTSTWVMRSEVERRRRVRTAL